MFKDKKKIILLLIFILFIFMGVGYSILKSNLYIIGKYKIKNPNESYETFDIIIDEISLNEKTSGVVSETSSVSNPKDKYARFSVNFNSPINYVVYDVIAKNISKREGLLKKIDIKMKPDAELNNYLIENNLKVDELYSVTTTAVTNTIIGVDDNKYPFQIKISLNDINTSVPKGLLNIEVKLNYIEN